MNSGCAPKGGAAPYTAACDSNGYLIMLDGKVVKTYLLDALCRSLPEPYRARACVEFAVYDIANAGFMLR
ncbi:hypothetical protein GCM10009552_16220 [Rothia nasimurium]